MDQNRSRIKKQIEAGEEDLRINFDKDEIDERKRWNHNFLDENC